MTEIGPRGWPVVFDKSIGQWRFEDTNEIVNYPNTRPCRHCGLAPIDNRDACFGPVPLPGVISACCGHGDPGRSGMRIKIDSGRFMEIDGFREVKSYREVAERTYEVASNTEGVYGVRYRDED